MHMRRFMVVMFAVCSAMAFRHTWDGFTRPLDPDRQASLHGLLTIGFVGSLNPRLRQPLHQGDRVGETDHRPLRPPLGQQHRRDAPVGRELPVSGRRQAPP
ncbi:hypothetical protein SUDANB2_07188 [Streptomyces sp. enrichment culture]